MSDARKAAEERYPALNPDDVELTYPRSALREFKRGAFVEGVEWQAARTVQGEPTDAEVRVAWRAFDECEHGGSHAAMRAALRAAYEVRWEGR